MKNASSPAANRRPPIRVTSKRSQSKPFRHCCFSQDDKNIQDGDLGPNYKDWPFILSKKASYIQARLLKRHPRTSWISDYGVFLVEIDRDTGAEGPTCWCCGLCGEIYAVKATSSAANHLEKKHHRYRDSSESEPPTKKRRTVLQQQRDATRIPVARSAEDCFKEAIVDWVVSNNIPFRGIENGAFRDILMLLNPSLTRALLPESHHTVKAWVQARYHCEFDVIKTMLAGGITKRHLSFDLWTSPNSYGLLAIIAHFLDANKVLQGLESRVLRSGSIFFAVLHKVLALSCNSATQLNL